MVTSVLGEFLRSRRGEVRPDEVGLPAGRARRVPGLRREEVAMLAGLSVDYYVRLEQGRERGPSAQVLDALAKALRLDHDSRELVFRLAGLAPRLVPDAAEQASAELLELMEAWTHHPALVLSRAYDVLACNRLGAALFDVFTHSGNLLLNIFRDPAAREFYADWQRAAVNTVAGFRLATALVSDDPRTLSIVEELRASSPDFREIWARNQARGKTAEVKTFVHPHAGPLTLRMQTFDVRAAPGQQLVVYHAEPGSADARALALLGSVAAIRDSLG